MANLSSDLQASIDNLQTEHTKLVQAVRDYTGGSVASATNDLLAAAEEVNSDIQAKESSLLGLINYAGDGRPVPSLIMDFQNQVYMKGTSSVSEGVSLFDLVETESYSNSGLVLNANGRYEPNPDPTQFRLTRSPETGEVQGVWLEGHSTNEIPEPDITAAYWGKENVSVVEDSSVLGPVEGMPVYKVTANNDNVFRSVRLVTPPTGNGPNAVSVFLKAGTANLLKMQVGLENDPDVGINIDCSTSEWESYNNPDWATVEPVADDWFRLTIRTDNKLYSQTKFAWFQAEEPTGATFYMSCPQIEQRNYSTSYIVEDAGSRTRNSDIMKMYTGNWFNPRKGTVVFDVYPRGENGNLWVVDTILKDRSNDYDPFSFRSAAGGQYWYSRILGNIGAEDGARPIDAIREFSRVRIVVTIDSTTGQSKAFINGVKVDDFSQEIGRQLMDIDYFLFGRWSKGSQFAFMVLRYFAFYPFIMTEAQAIAESEL